MWRAWLGLLGETLAALLGPSHIDPSQMNLSKLFLECKRVKFIESTFEFHYLRVSSYRVSHNQSAFDASKIILALFVT